MIKQKAPKDMTATELVDHLIDRLHNLGIDSFTEDELRYELNRPAINPFTPDQVTVMQEYQRDGYKYAAKSSSGYVCVFKNKPTIAVVYTNPATGETFGRWVDRESPFDVTTFEFLKKSTSWGDPEPLRFADYAPLEGETK